MRTMAMDRQLQIRTKSAILLSINSTSLVSGVREKVEEARERPTTGTLT